MKKKMQLLEISWPSHQEYLYNQIYKLYNAETGLDFELVLNEENSADASPTLKLHSLVFQIFCQSLTTGDLRHFHLEDEDIKKDDVRCLLEFIYRGRTYVELERFEAVKKAAEKLQLKTFTDLIEGITIENQEVSVEVIGEAADKNNVENIIVAVADKDKISEELNEDFASKDELRENSDELIDCLGDNLAEEKAVEPELNGDREQGGEDGEDANEDKEPNKMLENKEKQLKLLSLDNLINSCESYMKQNKYRKVNFACSDCNKQFSTLSSFKKHQKSHVKAADKCKGGKLELDLVLKHRMKLDDNSLEKCIKCDFCEYKCAAHFILKTHQEEFHKECNAALLTCDSCDFSCTITSDLNRHKRVKHSEKIECEICGKKCSRYSIKKHLELHDDVERLKKFKCTLCKFLSRYRFNLKVHFKKIHDKSEEEIESLLNSNEVRVSQDNLKANDDQGRIRRHFRGRKKAVRRRKVVGEAAKKKVCEICGLVLSGWSTLYRHKRLHREGDSLRRRYQCPECDFRTREKFQLRAHCIKKHEMSLEQFNSNFITNLNPTENVTVETILVDTEVEIASSIISINCADAIHSNI